MMKTKTRIESIVVKPSEVVAQFDGVGENLRGIGWWILEKIAFRYPDEDTRFRFGERIWEYNLDLEVGRKIHPFLKDFEEKGIDVPVEISVLGWETVEVCRCKKIGRKKGAR